MVWLMQEVLGLAFFSSYMLRCVCTRSLKGLLALFGWLAFPLPFSLRQGLVYGGIRFIIVRCGALFEVEAAAALHSAGWSS